MIKTYTRINWVNYPDTDTAVNATNLNLMDSAINEIDNRVVTLDSQKANQTDMLTAVSNVTLNTTTGIMTVSFKNGSEQAYNTGLAMIAVNIDYDYATQRLVIECKDGSYKYVDLSALITQYEFLDSSTIAISVDSTGRVTSTLKEGSVTSRHLATDYLGAITEQAGIASRSAESANASELNAQTYASRAESAESEIQRMTGMVQFDVNNNGELVYNDDNIGYSFAVDNNGNLTWEVVST